MSCLLGIALRFGPYQVHCSGLDPSIMALQASTCSPRSRAQVAVVRNRHELIRKHVLGPRSRITVARTIAPQALPELAQVLQSAPSADPEQTTQAVYVGLGLTLLSFVLTFGVAPRFKSSFKEPETWQEVCLASSLR